MGAGVCRRAGLHCEPLQVFAVPRSVGDPLDRVEEITMALYYPRCPLTGPWIGD